MSAPGHEAPEMERIRYQARGTSPLFMDKPLPDAPCVTFRAPGSIAWLNGRRRHMRRFLAVLLIISDRKPSHPRCSYPPYQWEDELSFAPITQERVQHLQAIVAERILATLADSSMVHTLCQTTAIFRRARGQMLQNIDYVTPVELSRLWTYPLAAWELCTMMGLQNVQSVYCNMMETIKKIESFAPQRLKQSKNLTTCLIRIWSFCCIYGSTPHDCQQAWLMGEHCTEKQHHHLDSFAIGNRNRCTAGIPSDELIDMLTVWRWLQIVLQTKDGQIPPDISSERFYSSFLDGNIPEVQYLLANGLCCIADRLSGQLRKDIDTSQTIAAYSYQDVLCYPINLVIEKRRICLIEI